jgi:DNA ligase (NAD+)
MPNDPSAQHAALVRTLEAHDYRYYVLDDPAVTDVEYDAVLRALRALEEAHPELVTADSPTQRVSGEPRSGTRTVRHAVRMFSLDNSYSEEDVGEFVRRVQTGLPDGTTALFAVEPKLDGGSVEVIYEGGRIVEASTRGDGEVGEEVTVNMGKVRGLPKRIDYAGRLTLRGEIVLFRRDFEEMNARREADGLEPFANPRNAAAGSIRMLDPKEVRARPLRVVFYQLVEGPALHKSHSESLKWLDSLHIPTHRREVVTDASGLMAKVRAIDAARAGYPYEIDGAVVKVDAYRMQDMLGFTSRFPKWAIAFKFAAERATTIVREINVQVGRTGALTPVAVLDPVILAGTTVARASLHNADQIALLDVRIGDHVIIEKAGEIIPQVVGVDPSQRHEERPPFTMPDRCPSCGTKVVARLREVDKPELGMGAIVRCPNRACPAQIKAQIHYFARRFAMDIDHLGVALVDQLVDKRVAGDVADLYDLTTEQIVALERMGAKSAQNVVDSIARSRTRPLDRLLCGLGIPQVGQVAARQIAEEARTLEALLAWTEQDVRERVGGIRGFGPKMVDSVVQYFADPTQKALMGKLHARGVGAPQPVAEVSSTGPLVGTAFCVTGVLTRKREEIHALLRAAGATIHDSVKKGTTYLVAGEKTGKSKLEQSKKFGTRVVNEEEMDRLIGGGPASLA